MTKFLIIEDEIAASTRLKRLVQSLRPESECLAELRGVEDALQWLLGEGQKHIDVAFVDIQLSDGISFEIFEHIEIMFPVIFTTAYDNYALQVFKVHTIDYLLKPIKQEQLSQALEKLDRISDRVELQRLQDAIASIRGKSDRQRFIVKKGRAIRIVHIADVSYFYSENRISYIVTFDGGKYVADETLDQIETSLDSNEFFRANRQYIVSISGIEEMQTYSRSRLKLKLRPQNHQELIVSTEKAPVFKEWLRGN